MAKKSNLSDWRQRRDAMQATPAWQRLEETMPKFYNTTEMTLEEGLQILRSIELDLIAVLPDLQTQDNDFRLGSQSYGYGKGPLTKDILGQLEYISDRWGCAFRVAWMLGLINEDFR